MRTRILALVLGFAPVGAGSSLAQDPAQTGTGEGPRSAITAPNTAATGRTKPPGAPAPPSGEGKDRFDELERKNRGIDAGICIGCSR